jgi:signal transduction histidine kinase
MGLGLYICYNIAKEFMGSLSAKNNPDQGMTFTLILPLMDDQDA